MASKKEETLKEKATKLINDVKDDTKDFTKEEKDSGKALAILSYLGILCLIPYFVEKKNKFVIYHAKEGLNLFLISIIVGIVLCFANAILFFIPLLGWLVAYLLDLAVSIGSLVLMIVGIVNVCNGQAKELPVINKFRIIK